MVKNVNRQIPADHILNLAQNGELKVVTSTLTLAEVYKLKSGPIAPSKVNDTILKTFARYLENDWITLVDVDRYIGERANTFCGQFNIYPNDAIHLACALRADCDYLLAWDDRFINVQHPDIKLDEPQVKGQTKLQFPSV